MTDEELEELLNDCPTLYHMAEQDSWASIEKYGLLSTTALLDQYEISGDTRDTIESARRPTSVALEKKEIGRAVVRDQSPMDDNGLLRCLQDGLTPKDWYRLLNRKVFFWLTCPRLLRLLKAGNYRNEEHDVLELETAPLIAAYSENIWFSAINSGSTKPGKSLPHSLSSPRPPLRAKIFRFAITPNHRYKLRVPSRQRGVSRSSRTLGWNAVDAGALRARMFRRAGR